MRRFLLTVIVAMVALTGLALAAVPAGEVDQVGTNNIDIAKLKCDTKYRFRIWQADSSGKFSSGYQQIIQNTAKCPPPPPSPPDTVLDSLVLSGTDGANATFHGVAGANNTGSFTYSCQMDTGAAVDCSSPAGYAGLAPGTHTFSVTATQGGLADPTPASGTLTVPTPPPPPPDTVIDDVILGEGHQVNATFHGLWQQGPNATEAFNCHIDGQAMPDPCTSPKYYDNLPAGTYTFSVAAIENGVSDPTPATRSFTINQPPPPSPPVPAFSFQPTDPVTGQQVLFDGSATACSATPCSYVWEDDGPDGPGGTQWPLGTGQSLNFTFGVVGTKWVRLFVTDALGQTASVEHDVVVSATPPPPPRSAASTRGLHPERNDGDLLHSSERGCGRGHDLPRSRELRNLAGHQQGDHDYSRKRSCGHAGIEPQHR